jgi:uroporphyrinogen-III synthase
LTIARELHEAVPAVRIGPVTANVAREIGWSKVFEAELSTIAGLVRALGEVLQVTPGESI